MKVIVQHPLYGTITYDSATKKATAQKGDIAERLTWLMNHPNEMPGDYYPNAFLRACELLGICGGELDVDIKVEGEPNPPPEATF